MNAAGRQVGARAMRSTVTRGEYVLFYVLLAILAARPLIGEVFERVEISFVAAMEDAGGPRPLTTAWLDLLLLVTAWAAFTLRAGRWRSSLALVGTGALILGGALSLWHASDLHIAIFAGSSLVISVLAGLALALVCTTRWQRQLIVAALLATGLTTALKCINQRYYEFPETAKFWEQTEKPRLIEMGYAPDDPLFVNYERRLGRARAARISEPPQCDGFDPDNVCTGGGGAGGRGDDGDAARDGRVTRG